MNFYAVMLMILFVGCICVTTAQHPTHDNVLMDDLAAAVRMVMVISLHFTYLLPATITNYT